jgi:trk system potassium uptake protein TrkH
MKLQIIFFSIGILLFTLGLALLCPFMLDLYDGHVNASSFGWSAVLAIFVGGALCISNYGFESHLSIRHAFLMTTISWLVVSFFSAFPLYISDLNISMTDAIFESVSGVTTTGSTVLSGLDQMSRGILLWRAITQWIGGIGIIAFAMILLPYLRIGGMQLFKSESSDHSEKIMPKTNDIVWSIIYVYVILTAACFVSFYLLGMPRFDALIHALTTIPTGGFSSHDASFGFYANYSLHMAATIFMLLGAVPFILFVKYAYKGEFDFFKDSQVRMFCFILAVTIGLLTLYLWMNDLYSFADSFKYAAFNIVSVITTTGYATTDYTLWGSFPIALFFFITYLGGCAGSTSGGIKMLRINIAVQALSRHMKMLVYPNGVFTPIYQGKPVTNDVVNAVMAFLFMYILINVLITMGLAMTGLDLVTSVTAAATAIANVGPGLGPIIGPAGNFSSLSDPAKWMLCAGMLLGRLEVMTMLVIITPAFWRD